MKAKDAVVGTRVRIKKGVSTKWYEAGQIGVIVGYNVEVDFAIVVFDHDGDLWYVAVEHMKRIKDTPSYEHIAVGAKVRLINNENAAVGLPQGTTGTVLEDSTCPFVYWDVTASSRLHDRCSSDGINRNYAVYLNEIEVIKE